MFKNTLKHTARWAGQQGSALIVADLVNYVQSWSPQGRGQPIVSLALASGKIFQVVLAFNPKA